MASTASFRSVSAIAIMPRIRSLSANPDDRFCLASQRPGALELGGRIEIPVREQRLVADHDFPPSTVPDTPLPV